jgi:FkbM family methyltransferase
MMTIAPLPLRLARFTRYLPQFRGLSVLLRVYRRLVPSDALFRVNDFDGDLKFDISVCETMGINLWHTPRLLERKERELFCSAITPGAVVLDVGANIGIYTLLAAKRGARVFAIEPDPDNVRALRHHIEINGFTDRVTVFELAATDHSQLMTLFRNSTNSGGSTLLGAGQGVIVEGRTIDSLDLPPVDVCKMDIEGAEVLALSGMSATLARSTSLKLLVECNQQLADTGRLLSLLRAQFDSVKVVGGPRLSANDQPPTFCNLWACH